MDNNDYRDIVSTTNTYHKEEYGSSKIYKFLLATIMGEKQCACTHTFNLHSAASGPLSVESIQIAIKSLKGQYVGRKCMVCKCQEFEEDNLEWLMKRKKWNSQSK
jgi:hypothetical protein